MKIFRLLLSFTFCFISIFAMSATGNNKGNAVSMISYEQDWTDYEGTLALKNNTNEEIHNVTFRVTYLNMDDTPVDYEDFTTEVNILPGMTKEINIPAYKKGKDYSYFESKNHYYPPKKFKIKYETLNYNVDKENAEEDKEEVTEVAQGNKTSSIPFFLLIIIYLLVIIFAFAITIGGYVLTAYMANKRNRSVILWLIISFFTTPIITIIILLCIGKSDIERKIE